MLGNPLNATLSHMARLQVVPNFGERQVRKIHAHACLSVARARGFSRTFVSHRNQGLVAVNQMAHLDEEGTLSPIQNPIKLILVKSKF